MVKSILIISHPSQTAPSLLREKAFLDFIFEKKEWGEMKRKGFFSID